VVSVEDSGIGIASGHAGRLGDAFFEERGCFDPSHDGLGLSIVKGLVALHGGEVAVRSKVGEGTRVTVRLPLDCERRHEPEPLREFVRSGDDEYPHMPPFATATVPRFKTAIKKSA
jgi:two-component system, cell cycle sensor histidine kinase DivJ